MTPQQISVCNDLIKDYNLEEDIDKKFLILTDTFSILRPFILKWMKAALSQKRRYYEPDELTSLSYDCFIFCLQRYNQETNIPLPNHFFSYTKFFLAINETKKNKDINKLNKQIELNEDNSSEKIECQYNDPFPVYESIDELKKFRESVPKEYQSTFDDALMSMTGRNKDKQSRVKESNQHYTHYYITKKMFKIIIDYLLRR